MSHAICVLIPDTDHHPAERVLVLAPLGRDGPVTAELLRARGLAADVCADAGEAGRQMASGAGALLLTEEALELAGADELLEHFRAQPAWSELPLIILTRGGESRLSRLLDLAAKAAGGVTLLERPLSAHTLLRTMEVALRSRRRQYQVRDLLEQERQQTASLRESEERFRTLANTIPQLAWWANPDGYITWYNDNWYRYTGTTPQQMEGWGWQEVHDPGTLPQVLERWKASLATSESFDMVFPLRGADGKFRSFLTRVHPLKDSAGRVVQWFGTNTDIEEIKQTEAALQATLCEKDVLLHEVHHRVKNNLQVISSLVSLQAESLKKSLAAGDASVTHDRLSLAIDQKVLAAFGNVQDQVRAMALVHEKLYQAGDFHRIDFADYTRALLTQLWRAHGETGTRVKLTLELQSMTLPLSAAVHCGLVLTELAGNSLKHAFPGRSSGGEVTISLQSRSEEPVHLQVTDNGVGLPEGLDLTKTQSLGLRLVQMLAKQLRGTFVARRRPPDLGGTEFMFQFPTDRAHAA